MRDLLPSIPSGRSRLRDGGWEASWAPDVQRVLGGLAGLIGPLIIVGANFLAGALFLVFFAIPALLELGVRWFPVQRARWDPGSLRLTGPVTRTWDWDEIDELGFDDEGRLRIFARGRETWVPGPVSADEREALLERWRACLTGDAPAPAALAPYWRTELDRQTVSVRFQERAVVSGYRPSVLRPALWAMWFWACTVAVAVVATDHRLFDGAGAILVLIGALAMGAVPAGMALFAAGSAMERGSITVDQHTLTLSPVRGASRQLAWDAIDDLQHDDLGLRLTTADGELTYDFGSEPSKRVRGLLGELEERWRARRDGADPQADRDALNRLRQRATERP